MGTEANFKMKVEKDQATLLIGSNIDALGLKTGQDVAGWSHFLIEKVT